MIKFCKWTAVTRPVGKQMTLSEDSRQPKRVTKYTRGCCERLIALHWQRNNKLRAYQPSCKSQTVGGPNRQTDRDRTRVRGSTQWDGSIPADIVAVARRQLFFHMVRLVAPFNRRAGGALSVAAVVLDGDWVTDHTHTHRYTDRISDPLRH